MKTDGGWCQIASWPLVTIPAISLYPPRIAENYNTSIFYILVFCIALVAIAGTIITRQKIKNGSFSRRQIWGPVLSLLLVFFASLTSVDSSGSDYRMKAFNIAALSDLKNTRTSLETYYADKKIYPKKVEEAGFESLSNRDSVRIDIIYSRTGSDKYRLTSSHVSGDREYMCSSDSPVIYHREKKGRPEEWRPM